MRYLPEFRYYFNKPDFPFEKAFLVSAKTIGRWRQYYRAELIEPEKQYEGSPERAGKLPDSLQKREQLIEDTLSWIGEHSQIPRLFVLFLDPSPILDYEGRKKKYRLMKFEHHEDTCCWSLDLTEEEFKELQKQWKLNDLPQDLFYPEDKGMTIRKPGIWGKLGFWEMYSAKEWEEKMHNSNT